MTIWSTKYALSKGIQEMVPHQFNGDRVWVHSRGCLTPLDKGDWFHTLKEAEQDAEKRLRKRIAQLQNQLKRMTEKNITMRPLVRPPQCVVNPYTEQSFIVD